MANTRRNKKSNNRGTMRGGLFGVPGLGRRIRGFFGGPAPSDVNLAETDSQRQTREFGSGLASGARTVGSTLGAAGTAVGSAVGSAGRATYDIMKAQSYYPQPNFNNGMKQVNKYRKAEKAQNAINAFNAYQRNYSRISKNNAKSPYLKQLNNAFGKARNNTANAAWRNSTEYLEYLNRVNKPKAKMVRNRLAAKAAAALGPPIIDPEFVPNIKSQNEDNVANYRSFNEPIINPNFVPTISSENEENEANYRTFTSNLNNINFSPNALSSANEFGKKASRNANIRSVLSGVTSGKSNNVPLLKRAAANAGTGNISSRRSNRRGNNRKSRKGRKSRKNRR